MCQQRNIFDNNRIKVMWYIWKTCKEIMAMLVRAWFMAVKVESLRDNIKVVYQVEAFLFFLLYGILFSRNIKKQGVLYQLQKFLPSFLNLPDSPPTFIICTLLKFWYAMSTQLTWYSLEFRGSIRVNKLQPERHTHTHTASNISMYIHLQHLQMGGVSGKT